MGVIDQHWDEWLANPFPDDETDLKAWQVDMQRLVGVTAARAKQFKALLESNSPPSAASSDAAALSKQLQEDVDSLGKLNVKVLTLRWVTLKEDPATKRTRTRQDLLEMRELYSQMRELVGRALKLLAEADSKGIDLFTDQSEKYLGRPDFWRAMERAYDATSANFALYDQHWDEWMAEADSRDGKDLKPWQQERDRNDEVVAAALKQARESAAAPVTPAPAPSPPGSNIKRLLKQADALMVAPATPAPAPSPSGSHMDQLILKTHLLPAVAEYRESLARLRETRWVKSPNANAYHPQKITRADLHDANEKLRALIASIDRLRRDLDAVTVPVPAAEKEYWRVKRETSLAFQQLTGLLEENWKEWHVSGIEPKTGEIKSWQKEAGRLQGEVDKLKQIEQTSILL
jgi:DNA segregation ATPase FtsK/SpoIIIE-like protein